MIYINDILCDYKGLAPYDTHLKVRDGTVSISTATFLDLENIVSVMLPGSVSSIGQEAFSGCTGLTEITCKAAVPPICEADCFLGVEQRDCKLYVAEVSVEAYRNAPVWQNFDIIATDFSGIEGIWVDEELDETQSPLYDLQGRRVTGTPERGLYIRNGKKVWIK